MKRAAILPAALMDYSHEYHFGQMYSRSRAVYILVLIFVAGVIGAIFFVSVPIIVNASGMLVSPGGHSWIKAPVSGRIAAVYAKENQRVADGQLLFSLESTLVEADLSHLAWRKKVIRRKISDLQQLVRTCDKRSLSHRITLRSSLYAREYELFARKVSSASDRVRKSATACRRNEVLFSEGVLAAAEFEEHRFALRQARNELYLLYEDQGGSWQAALNRLTLELEELVSKEAKLSQQKELYSVRAPSGGILQETDGLRPGSFYNQGTSVAQLSADSGLLVKALIDPGDIGLIKKGMPVRIQIDAVNYRQSEAFKGVVTDISGDVLMQRDQTPWFEVMCTLEKSLNTSDPSSRKKLVRGMRVQATFIVAERTLFQLLYNSINDQLDPYARHKD